MKLKLVAAGLLTSLFLTGCTATVSGRAGQASDIAQSAQLQPVKFNAPPFQISGWQKIDQQEGIVHIYIEGDGLAWTGRNRPSPNPTPKNPMALKLARLDPAPNVVYLGRPCQYTTNDPACGTPTYWTDKRFSEEVVHSYMKVLDDISARSGTSEFYVTGYSGGANIAGLLAARREDITRLMTVAGNLDNDYFTRLHGVSAMPLSLNMANDAASLSTIPQIHFIGADDDIVPVSVYQSYALKARTSPCIQSKVLPNVTHGKGWEDLWPSLLQMQVKCH